jgi:hypothetical protein
MTAINNAISEFEFRLNIAVDNGGLGSTTVNKNIKLADNTTDNTYKLYVDNGNLMMAEQEE